MSKFSFGDVLEVKMDSGDYCYAHYLRSPIIAFYDLKSAKHASINDVINSSVLFAIAVHDSVVRSDKWKFYANVTPSEALSQEIVFFRQDIISGKVFKHYEDGREEISSKIECEKLERAAVWDHKHVEDRLEDHFKGVENKWVKSLKMK